MSERRFGRASCGVFSLGLHLVRADKGRAARVLRQEFAHLRRFATVMWSPAYLAAWVGSDWESTVRGCIEHEWDGVAS